MASFTASQQRMFAIAFQCMESDPKIDFDKFAALASLKNAASARETFRQCKKKLLDNVSVDATDAKTKTKTPAKKQGGKADKNIKTEKGDEDAADEDEDGDEASPVKSEYVSDEQGEGTSAITPPATVKRGRGRPRKNPVEAKTPTKGRKRARKDSGAGDGDGEDGMNVDEGMGHGGGMKKAKTEAAKASESGNQVQPTGDEQIGGGEDAAAAVGAEVDVATVESEALDKALEQWEEMEREYAVVEA